MIPVALTQSSGTAPAWCDEIASHPCSVWSLGCLKEPQTWLEHFRGKESQRVEALVQTLFLQSRVLSRSTQLLSAQQRAEAEHPASKCPKCPIIYGQFLEACLVRSRDL